MAVGPQPYAQTQQIYTVEATGNPNEYRILTAQTQQTIIRDFRDTNLDDAQIFGDVPNDTVSINESGTSDTTYFALSQSGDEYVFSDSNGGLTLYGGRTRTVGDTFIAFQTPAAVCYASGTRIRTVRGDVPVEALKVGDHVVTASGALRPIRWLGHRKTPCRGRPDLQPVRIAAGAFGPGRPARDLLVSPAHAIAVETGGGEALVPAIRLVNGTTITRADIDVVTYWHVELDSHDLLLAEGLPAESYLDCGNRRFFANAPVTSLRAVPDKRLGELPFCRPLYEAGPVVEAARVRLEERAVALGWRRVEDTFAGLHLIADGRAIQPTLHGFCARFVLPADARDVRLISETSVPAHVVPGSSDDRRLGVGVTWIAFDDDATGARQIAADDERLREGWHDAVAGTRWTDGAAVLPTDLWAGCEGAVRLDAALVGPALPRWIAPDERIDSRQRA